VELGLVESLFNLFLGELERNDLVVNEGKIVDASFVDVPRQRNSRDENQLIKDGETPATLSENPNVLSQKDLDARWTKKNGQSYYGYKNHIKVDSKSKLITKYTVTDASVHDSQAIADLLEEEKDKGQPFFADSAYTGPKQQNVIEANGMESKVCEKGVKNKPLTQEQVESNRLKSKTRSRVEHIFGFMEMSMNGMYINTIGIKRATATIGMMNLVYNMFRKASLV
jgi:transposase, IS5 family